MVHLKAEMLIIGYFISLTNLDDKLANINSSEDFVDNLDTLGVRDHCVEFASNVKVTLVEFAQSTSQYAWVVSPVYLFGE